MKNLFSVLAFVFLSVVGVYGQQIDVEKGLPIGSNVDNRSAQVRIALGADSLGRLVGVNFQYNPAEGSLKTVIDAQVKNIAAQFTPPSGFETDIYGLFGQTDFAYFDSGLFRLERQGDKWVVPPEVLDVELNYGEVTRTLSGVIKVEIDVRGGSRAERFSSDGGGVGSPCFIQAVDRELGLGLVILAREYVVPKYRDNWWTEGEVTLWEGYRYASFNLLDGSVISYSSPPPVFLKFPDPKLEIVKTSDGLEFSVSNVGEQPFVIESSVDFVTWDKYPTVGLTSVAGKKSLRAKPLGPNRFFRLRIEDTTPLKR